jgi:hypothetical protein
MKPSAHGIQRTVPDKQNAVRTMLTNPLVCINLETGKPWNDHEIARRCAVSYEMVRKHRAAICQQLADSELGKQLGSEERTVTRGGTTYTMKTGNIGRQAHHLPLRQLLQAGKAADLLGRGGACWQPASIG